MNKNKIELFNEGVLLMQKFCQLNDRLLPVPELFNRHAAEWPYRYCAFYRVDRKPRIEICIKKCAAIGVAGPAWSYPGNTIDRTPYGVLQHEIGHHADAMMSGLERGYIGEYSTDVRQRSGELKLTNYCPNDGEWFAEMFRLFVTNPDLLSYVRPRTYAILCEDFRPLRLGSWEFVLNKAPLRTIAAVEKKIEAAR